MSTPMIVLTMLAVAVLCVGYAVGVALLMDAEAPIENHETYPKE
jgi:Na+-transporting methylmalonyl-CoA/oxaloacetate decarboxylase gamma subunit